LFDADDAARAMLPLLQRGSYCYAMLLQQRSMRAANVVVTPVPPTFMHVCC